MQATYAVVPGEEQLVIEHEELDPATMRSKHILVEAETTVISAGTELAIYTALAPGVHTPGSWNAYPWRPGYGLVGHILAAGENVAGLASGDRIFCFGQHASHQFYDVSGRETRDSAFVIDESLSAKSAVMLRMALIALTGSQMAVFEIGDTVCVFGLGLVGNLVAQLFQISGAHVIALDPVMSRCDLAREIGIDTVLHASAEQHVEAVLEQTGGEGVTVAVDAVGHTPVIQNCIEVCVPFGQVVLLGSPRAAFEYNATEAFRAIHNRWLTVKGALEWCLPAHPVPGKKHSIESNLHMLIELVRQRKLDVDGLISHVITPDAMPTAFQGLLHDKSNYIGVVVDWKQ
jgi:2-desacetyl-2-hydroxyethyl bacteriochlorophyllide A dehydrogenase